MSIGEPKIGVANVHNSDDYKRGYRQGYQDGLDAARILYDPYMPVAPVLPNALNKTCKTCGIKLDRAMGYVCYHPECPSKIFC
jgi:hypothetical protein